MFHPMQYLHDVARVSHIPVTDLLNTRKRAHSIVRVRQAMMFVLVRKMRVPYAEAARRLGGMDHTSVMHGVARMTELLQEHDPQALRCYKIAIRCHLRLRQQNRDERREVQELLERIWRNRNVEHHDVSHADQMPGAVPELRGSAHGEVAAAAR